MKNALNAFRAFAKAHKILVSVIAVTCVVGGYEMYVSAKNGSAVPQYVVAPAMIGNIVQTVSGTGQVTAANQIDIASQVSGAITSIDKAVGDHVYAGDLISTIDPTDAATSLASARLSLAQLTEPAKPGDIANAENSLEKAYSDGFNAVSNAFIDLHTVMPGLNNMFYEQGGFLSVQNSASLDSTGQAYRSQAGSSYDKASAEYQTVLAEYAGTTRNSATSSIDRLISDSYSLEKDVSSAVGDAQSAITYITVNEPDYQSRGSSAAESSVSSWGNLASSDVSALGGASNTIASDANTLNNLITGADPLAIQASELSVAQAQKTYEKYFIRAPFDGVIGRIPVSLYNQASNGTVIATVIGSQKIANISLDEVDAANVKVGQPVTITFDAISGFTATGTVSEVDLVGSVSAGVVSYGVKIAVNTPDPRILPGMSLNVSIVTNEIDGVLIVPTAAVKTQGNRSYVQTFDQAVVGSYIQSQAAASGRMTSASSTRSFGNSGTGSFASSTYASSTGRTANGYASSTRAFSGSGTASGRTISVTMPSVTPPTSTVVTIGQSDTTNTQILSGLTAGEWVVTRTVAASAASSASAPSFLSSLGARAGGGAAGGAARAAGGAAAGR